MWALLRPSCNAMALAHESYIKTPVLRWSSMHLLRRLCILSTGRWRPLTQPPTMALVAKGRQELPSTHPHHPILPWAKLALHFRHIVVEGLAHNFAIPTHNHGDARNRERTT